MAKIVNLRRARKSAARDEKREKSAAATQAARHSNADKAGIARARQEAARLEGKKRDE